MPQVDLNRELSDQDYDTLSAILTGVIGGRVPNLEALDGFLTALVICPELIRPGEFVPFILFGKTEDDDLVFESVEEAEGLYGFLMRYWNQINHAFREGDVYMPYLLEDEEGVVHGNEWAKGFLEGTRLRYDAWQDLIHDEERSGSFVPIWALAYENAEDPSLRPYKEPLSVEKRQELLVAMIAGVKHLYDIFRQDAATSRSLQVRSSSQKVGRNDPCPCGSGKKFKKCCG